MNHSNWLQRLIPLLTLGAVTVCAAPASAWVKFKNNTNKTVTVAFAIKDFDDGGWADACNTSCDPQYKMWGWYNIPTGQTVSVMTGSSSAHIMAFHAYSADKIWQGTEITDTCLPGTEFEKCHGVCQSPPPAGYRAGNFQRISNNLTCAGTGTNLTVNLN